VIVSLSAQVVLGALGMGAFGLLLGDILGRTGGVSRLVYESWRSEGATLRKVRLGQIIFAARRYRRFPIHASLAALLGGCGGNLPPILLGAFFGPGILGFYGMANRIVGAPFSLISLSVGSVYSGSLGGIKRDNRPGMMALFIRVTKAMAFAFLPITAGLMLVRPSLLVFILGARWAGASTYVNILAILFFFQGIATPVGSTLEILERQGLLLARDTMRAVLMPLAIVVGYFLFKQPVPTVILLTIGGVITYIAYLLFCRQAIVDRERAAAGVTLPIPAIPSPTECGHPGP
jgi:O-antigen/teichoic acid export membrane protein